MAEKTAGRWLFAARGILGLTLWVLAAQPLTAGQLDLHKAVVVSPGNLSKQEKKAIALLVDEVQKRTLVRWEVTSTRPAESIPVIAVGQASSLPQLARPYAKQLANRKVP